MAKRNKLAKTGINFFSTLRMWRKALRGQRYSLTSITSNGSEVTRLVDYETYCEEGYKRNAVVFSAVREIARTAPSARIQVRRRLKRGQTEIYEEHPLQAVLDMPNPKQSHYDFVELLLTYLNLDGNVFILRDREGKHTKALWLPRPDKFTPVIDKKGILYEPDTLVGYTYSTPSDKLYFMPEDVIHIKYPNPGDPYHGAGRGIPPLSAAAYDADNDNSQTSFIKQFFKNGAVPSGIIKSKNILDDTEVKRIQQRLSEQYSGEQNWHKIMVLDADAEYQQTGLRMDQMVFPELRAISETRICAAFKVPPVLIGVKSGLDAATYSNYKLARQALWEDNIIPTNMKLAEAFTRAFSDELGKSMIIKHDYADVVALQQDRTDRFARASQAVMGGWITVNEARREVTLGPLPQGVGDVLYRPLMAEPVDDGAGDAADKGKVFGIGEKVTPTSHENAQLEIASLQDASQSFLAMTEIKGFEGVMIGFGIPSEYGKVLADAVGELPEGSVRTPVEEMHITLALTTDPSNDVILKAVNSVAEKWTGIEGKLGGLIKFPVSPDGLVPICAHFDSPKISEFREEIMTVLRENGVNPLETHGFTPHITLAYLPEGSQMPEIDVPGLTLQFDRVSVSDQEGEIVEVRLGEIASLQDATQSQARNDKEVWAGIIYKRFDRVSRAWEKKFKETAAKVFEGEGQSIEAAIRSKKSSIKTIDYNEIWKEIETWLSAQGMQEWAASFEPLMLGLTEDQMAEWAAALGIDWSIENPAVASFIHEHSYRFAEKIGTTTRNNIRRIMDSAQSEGWSVVRMIDEVRSVYGGWSETRAEMIARSETIRSSNAGAVEAYRQGGITTEEWYASLDERTCSFCGEMHGTQIAVGGVFAYGDTEMVVSGQRLRMDYGDVQYPPLHPECRCTVLPVVLEKMRLMANVIKAKSAPQSPD